MFARFLDRHAENDWSYFFGLFAAAFGTLLLVFDQTLNNHTVAAYAGFFAMSSFLKIWSVGTGGFWTFASAGFWAAFCANELPAALFVCYSGPSRSVSQENLARVRSRGLDSLRDVLGDSIRRVRPVPTGV